MIQFESVAKTFTTGGLPALHDVTLSIAASEIFGVIGRSGAGKSTLVRLINGLERPSSGRVVVDGQDVGAARPADMRALRRRVGMIFQQFGLLSSATVADNMALPLRIAGVPADARKARVADLLDRVGLAAHGHKYPGQLSGGQKQRVGIARAIAGDARILLCDEATSALDPETTRDILSLIADLNRDLGLTIVMITHEMEVVREVCDRVAVLDAGRLVETGPVADIFLRPQAAETRRLLAQAGEGHADHADFPGRVVRLTFEGDAIAQPVLTRVARETGVDLVVLGGHIGRFRQGRYGQLTLGVTGDAEAAVAALATYGAVS
ncbi:methionine ABC transporter ATP-binding protein [Sphingomonas montanisoli]|uniref:Cell division ATP-binding protein FtsE n=1 Tax=Sphingomonas montanisoli TaxID=2606412 RepID=A0A5D9BZU5_9SPHN|nr:ATP-binding cassette domain-containing protein [Sphingomonas montanisoli]TZG24994.1 ATP-binding cassette domain-containing protein [Sphingomonas montanisoli]